MLMLYGLDDSPDAATTAISLAAHWASQRREVLLIEADPAGGTISNNLGMPFTPGSASFVASGLSPLSNHLIDHAQDVLYENLHIMPAPASPSGASSIAEVISEHAEALRGISEHEMAVIIEGGRISASTVNAKLALNCAALVAVASRESQMSNVEHFKRLIGGRGRPKGCAVSIGQSPWSDEEWQQAGLAYVGAIEHAPHMAGDLSPFLNKGKGKRKTRGWRSSLDTVGTQLYAFAQPPPASKQATEESVEQAAEALESDSPADEAAASTSPVSETPDGPEEAAAAAHEPPEQPAAPAAHEQTAAPEHPAVPAAPAAHEQPQQPPAPAPYEQPQQPPAPAAHGQPVAPAAYEQPLRPPAPAPYEQAPPAGYQQPAAPAAHEQPQQPPAPAPYEQAPPGSYQQAPAGYPPAPGPYDQPPPGYEQPQQPSAFPPAPGSYPPPPPAYPPPPGYEQPQQPSAFPPARPAAEEPPREPTPPTGSFRDWAAKLKGVDEHGNRSTGRGTA